MSKTKVILFVLIILVIGSWFYFDLGQYVSFEKLKQNQSALRQIVADNFITSIIGFFVLYIAVTALSLPGAAILTLTGGAIFGFITGFIIVSFASSIGATLAFLVARFLLQDTVRSKFANKLEIINNGIYQEGAFYLFTLRLIPVIPFFVINLVLGLTKMKVATFYWVSQLGMLPATVIYVNAGTQLATIESPNEILSVKIVGSLVLLGLFPLVTKKLVDWMKKEKNAKV